MIIALLLAAASLRAADAADRPYAMIVSRNMFGLLPILPEPTVPVTDIDPPPKITLNGITSIFGKVQVLYKVTPKAKPGQPVTDDAYMMGEGERQDDIEVTKIDEKAGVVTFNNHGNEQTLTLELAKGATGGGPGSPAGGPGGGPGGGPLGMPGLRPGMGARPGGMGMPSVNLNQNGAVPNNGVPTMPNFGGASFGGANKNGQNNNGQAQELSPEAKVLLIEAQRQAFQAEGNPIANILPPPPPGVNVGD